MLSMRTRNLKEIENKPDQLFPKMVAGFTQVLRDGNLMIRPLIAGTDFERVE